jgi:hypothetical protein
VWEVRTIDILILPIFRSNSSVKDILKKTTDDLSVSCNALPLYSEGTGSNPESGNCYIRLRNTDREL